MKEIVNMFIKQLFLLILCCASTWSTAQSEITLTCPPTQRFCADVGTCSADVYVNGPIAATTCADTLLTFEYSFDGQDYTDIPANGTPLPFSAGVYNFIFRVSDNCGTVAECESIIEVVDCPALVNTSCQDLPANFDPNNISQLQQLVGLPDFPCASGSAVELAPIVNNFDCGAGQLTRQFEVSYPALGGPAAVVVFQTVTIENVQNYAIKFPQDTQQAFGIPIPEEIVLEASGCDILAASFEDEYLAVAGEECLVLSRTYRVVNWCEYGGDADPIVVDRDEDCDGLPGDEDIWVMVRPDGGTYYDRDNDETNAIPAALTKADSCDGFANPTGYWLSSFIDPTIESVGYWEYTQFITITGGSGDPIIQITTPSNICASDDCPLFSTIDFAAVACPLLDNSAVELRIDLDNDGSIEEVFTGADLEGNSPNFSVPYAFPIGSHRVEVAVNVDGQPEQLADKVIEVTPCGPPAATCIANVTATFAPLDPPEDIDGDGDLDVGKIEIFAGDLLLTNPVDLCGQDLSVSINKVGELPNSTQSSLVLTCDDIGLVPVQIYIWDDRFNPDAVQPDGTVGGPNYEFCESTITAIDVLDVCSVDPPVDEGRNYGIKFPKDIEQPFGTPVANGVMVEGESDCDILAVSYEDEYLSVLDGGCLVMERTFTVLNWCEYDGSTNPIVVGRDEDCDGLPGDEDIWVLVRPNGATYYDRDNDETNAIPAAFAKADSCDGFFNPEGRWLSSFIDPSISSVGYWQYTQLISFTEDVTGTPIIQINTPSSICAGDDCPINAAINFAVAACPLPEASNIRVRIDLDNDGSIEEVFTGMDLEGNSPNFSIPYILPIGSHGVEIVVSQDGLPDVTAEKVISVTSCAVPALDCVEEVIAAIAPLTPPTDIDEDGDMDAGRIVIWASDFLTEVPTDPCGQTLTASINRVGELPDREQLSLLLTCDDLGNVPIQIYVWDDRFNPDAVQPDGTVGGPNYEFCESIVEVVDLLDVCSTNLGNIPMGRLSGAIFIDENTNCALDGSEEGPSSWIVQATGAAGTYYTTSEADGHYEFDIPQGDYAISLQPPVAYWAACNEEAIISLGESTTVEQSVGVSALYECPHLEVDVSAPLLQACSSNYYEVQYCNLGTAVAEGAYVEVQFDPFMTVTSSTLPWSTATDQTYTFPIGEVAPGQCGSFRVAFTLACDAIAGQTHCTEAVIYPNNSCLPDEALWDGASLELAGDCLGDSIQFLIRNIGDSMESPVQYIVVEDHLIMVSGAIQLAAGETRILSTDANGSTKRLEIPQSPGHPGNSHPSLSIEACGVNEDGNVSLGIITTLPEDDGDAFVSMDCQENVETHESNAKRSFPQGIGSSYLIEADNRLDYHLRFQNTGAEPVSTVIIRDTLSSWLNPASVRPGASSHNYEWALSGEGVLTITFANINLPSSSIDETASTGFVKFNIEQQEGNAVGTEIRNESYVYLDDNDPIVMNQTFHTIGENLLVPTKAGVSGTVYLEDGTLLEGVEVTLSTPSGQEQTASNNFIFVDLPTLETYHLATAKAATAREGLNVVDLILMIRHVLGVEELSPLQQLAADVDGSGLISLSDLIDVQKVILGISNTFPVAPAWQFVRLDRTTLPAAFVSANGISVNSLIHPLDYELYAYKLGDIDESASLMQSSIVPRNQLPMTLRAEAEPLPNGKTLIQLYGQAAWLAEGLQLQLHVGEHRMELMEHEALSALGQLDYVLAEGQLNVVWHSPEAVALPEEALLSFVVDGKVDESWLHFDESHAYQQAYDGQLERHAIRWATQPIAEEQLTVFPNPTRGPITIQYQLVEAGAAAISLMDSKGTVLKSWQEQFPSGQHQLSLSTSDVAPGVYFIHLQTANGMKVQRLIVL